MESIIVIIRYAIKDSVSLTFPLETLAGLYANEASCDPRNHTGRSFGDIFETMFVIAWIQLVPSMLSLLHYLGSIFAKGRDLVCCCESWKKAKVDADARTEIGDDEPGKFRRTG